MLTSLSIRDVVLIDRLDLALDRGLCVLTGETGAGKSILLDALGLALGWRADPALVREGADQAAVTASFDLPDGHAARLLLEEQGIEDESDLILRRHVSRDGRSRAFVNDRAISVGFLRRLGESLVEIHGQHDEHGLLDAASHRALLDDFAGNGSALKFVRAAFADWQAALAARRDAEQALAKARAEEDYLRHVAGELDQLAPEPGEEAKLAAERQELMAAEKIGGALEDAYVLLDGDGGATSKLAAALRKLDRGGPALADTLRSTLEALTRAANEAAEAASEFDSARRRLNYDAARLERCEERLFKLRAAARKHNVAVDALSDLAAEFRRRIEALDHGSADLDRLAKDCDTRETQYRKAAAELSELRKQAATRLDRAVASELKPLKLDAARFRTTIETSGDPGADGMDRVSFEIATNPGAPFGALSKIASGGELARFVLALKVALARRGTAETLIFDEVDRGIGGAVAAAVGARLSRLAVQSQILVETHSPQVAARGTLHWKIAKRNNAGRAITKVEALDDPARLEEIARMIAGARITDEARAAAASLLKGDAA